MGLEANKAWRKKVFWTTDPAERKLLRKCCAEDAMFYINGFVNIFDAGDESGKPGPVPFVMHPFQVEAFTKFYLLLHHYRKPSRTKKPRKLGITYLFMWLFGHAWHWLPNIHILVGSHRQEEVDGSSTMGKGSEFFIETSKLLPKIDFGHVYMPGWLLPVGYRPRTEPYRMTNRLMNPENGSLLWATSAAGVAGHGGRGYGMGWDEAAKTETLYDIMGGMSEFAPAKFWVSTIEDLGHTFSTILRDAPGIEQINLEWWMHPDYAEGLTLNNPERPGGKSSPWLERKLAEINYDPIQANRNYYADETRQIGGFYHAKTFERMLGLLQGFEHGKRSTIMEPLFRGELDVLDNPDGPAVNRFCRQANGRWQLWFNPDSAGRPPRSTRYILGADLSAGTGASNSVLAVADWMTGELVAEYAINSKTPEDMARLAFAASHWFHGDDGQPARIIFECNGPSGTMFGQVLEKLGHPNLYKREDGSLGWFKDNRQPTEEAFNRHQLFICEGKFTERSMDCVDEMRCYQLPKSGKGPPVHTASKHSEDPSGAGENHGDRVIARICICVLLQRPYDSAVRSNDPPERSYRGAVEREAREAAYQTEMV